MANIFDGLVKTFAGLITTIAETPCRFLVYADGQNFAPSTGEWETSVEADSGSLKCSPPDAYAVNLIDGTQVKRGDFRVLIGYDQWEGLAAAFGDKPSTQMVLKIETDQHAVGDDYKEYTIIDVKPFETGSSVAAWEVQARG